MSSTKEILEIVPNELDIMYGCKLESKTNECPMCKGTGVRNVPCESKEMITSTICKYCNGTGRLHAKISIVWKPII